MGRGVIRRLVGSGVLGFRAFMIYVFFFFFGGGGGGVSELGFIG